ncbi:hypothetical protein Emed_007588 [Eimeria media]
MPRKSKIPFLVVATPPQRALIPPTRDSADHLRKQLLAAAIYAKLIPQHPPRTLAYGTPSLHKHPTSLQCMFLSIRNQRRLHRPTPSITSRPGTSTPCIPTSATSRKPHGAAFQSAADRSSTAFANASRRAADPPSPIPTPTIRPCACTTTASSSPCHASAANLDSGPNTTTPHPFSPYLLFL